MVQRSDAWIVHGFAEAQENEQGARQQAVENLQRQIYSGKSTAAWRTPLCPTATVPNGLGHRAQIRELSGRDSSTVEKPLQMFTATGAQGHSLTFPLNTLCHRLHAERRGEVHH